MKSKLFSKRMTRGIVCGLVGVLILSVSAFAAYGSTSGYGKYKDAVTNLVVNSDNMTIKASSSVSYDGDTPSKTAVVYKQDGKNSSTHEKSLSKGSEGSDEYFYWVIDGTATSFSKNSDTYSQYPDESDGTFLNMGKYSDKVVKFASLFADTVLGDLKNNVVLVGDEDGIRSYSLDVSAEQVPALINAGIDLVLTQENTGGYTTYEDQEATFAIYYEKIKGEKCPDDFFGIVNSGEYNEFRDEFRDVLDEVTQAMDEEYYKILEEQYNGEGILYVKADGSYTAYPTYSEYAMENEYGTSDLEAYLGKNAVLDGVKFNFSLDEKDRLVSNDMTISLSSTDDKGKEHDIQCSFALKISDYGTTQVTPFDVGNRTKVE